MAACLRAAVLLQRHRQACHQLGNLRLQSKKQLLTWFSPNLSIYIYLQISIYISISLKCTYLPLSIFIRLSIYLSIYLSINISLYLSIFLLINLYIYLSVSSSYLSIYTYVYEYPGESLLSINLPMLFDQWLKLLTYSCQDTTIYLFIHLSIHPGLGPVHKPDVEPGWGDDALLLGPHQASRLHWAARTLLVSTWFYSLYR